MRGPKVVCVSRVGGIALIVLRVLCGVLIVYLVGQVEVTLFRDPYKANATITHSTFALSPSLPAPLRILTTVCRSWSKQRMLKMIVRVQSFVRDLRKDNRGQDLIEYALMAGFVAVAAGAIMPGVATSISTIFSKVASTMSSAASQGS